MILTDNMRGKELLGQCIQSPSCALAGGGFEEYVQIGVNCNGRLQKSSLTKAPNEGGSFTASQKEGSCRWSELVSFNLKAFPLRF